MSRVPAHGPQHERHTTRWLVGAIVVVVLAALGAGSYLFVRSETAPPSEAGAQSPRAPSALTVVGTSPANGATDVAADAVIDVEVSTALASDSPMPVLDPPVGGSWTALSPTELQFSADGPLLPGSQERVVVPGGAGGIAGARGQLLAATVTNTFTVAPASTLRLQQLLAELGYLPLSFTPTLPQTSPTQTADVAPGNFAWRWSTLPSTLTSLWTPGTYNVLTKAAVMTFEDQHGMATDGLAGPDVWSALLSAAQTGSGDPDPWDYVLVTKGSPENAAVYQNGGVVYTTPVNTGVPAAPTVDGTFPVFEHVTSTTMTGTNPDGSHYSDPGVPWVSYFNGGDALHGFVRPGYGYPQSDGCVEMPVANAAVVFPYTPIGTLVSVTG